MTGCYHVVGVAGVGMSALAEALLDAGCRVSGSDRLADMGDPAGVLRKLEAQGVRLCRQDGSGVVVGVDALVVSSAIEDDNPDVMRAEALGIPRRHRAEILKEVVAGNRLLTIAGTCGKSTVTAMTGWILDAVGLDPLVVNGAPVVNWCRAERTGSTRAGSGEWAIIEADESDRSLLNFHPDVTVITNRSADHFDLAQTCALFEQFAGQVRGAVIDGEACEPPTITMVPGEWGCRFVWREVAFEVPCPGRHNGLNAWLAASAAELLGVTPEASAAALREFGGVVRRLERIGRCGAAVVVDDYGHNPCKLEAAWLTLAERFESVVGVWRPHGYGPLRAMMDDLTAMWSQTLRPSDRLWLLPVYDAGGTADRSVQSDVLVARLQQAGMPVGFAADAAAAERAMRDVAAPGVALVTLGARDPDLPRLARRLTEDRTLHSTAM